MKLKPHERRAVAVAADTTDYSVKRYLQGATNQNALVRKRIENALTAAGHQRLVRGPKPARVVGAVRLEVVRG